MINLTEKKTNVHTSDVNDCTRYCSTTGQTGLRNLNEVSLFLFFSELATQLQCAPNAKLQQSNAKPPMQTQCKAPTAMRTVIECNLAAIPRHGIT